MCGRFSLKLPIEELARHLAAEEVEISPRYNIAPTQEILILREGPEGGRELASVRWGLVPSWMKEPTSSSPLINARCETVATKPSFRDAFLSRRCLIPASGFYEWKKEGRKRLPYHITFRDSRPMLFTGIWERWQNPADPKQIFDSCAILTSEACSAIRPLHDRMPVLIPITSCDIWLKGKLDQAFSFLAPYAGDDLLLKPANPIMNSADQEGPDCLMIPQRELF